MKNSLPNKNDPILVTGGNGFIGSHVIDLLIETGYSNVFSVDNFFGSNNVRIKNENENCNYFFCDILNKEELDWIIKKNGIKNIIHLAANANVPYSSNFPEWDFNYNAKGVFTILQSSLKNNIHKFIFASSAAVYGEPLYTPMDEGHPLNPLSNYGVTKLYGEKLGMAYHKMYGLNFTAMRIFNAYGPRQTRYILYDILLKIKKNPKNVEVLGTGNQIRDFLYVKDTARAFILALESENSSGKTYNVCGEDPIKIADFIKKISDVLNIKTTLNFTGKSWPGDIKILTGTIKKLSKELGFFPSYNLKDGLSEAIHWFQTKGYIN